MTDLLKSIDALIDEAFAEPIAKADMMKEDKAAKETADEALAGVPKAEKDEKRGEGRPKQISQIPQEDTDGKRDGDYDGDIAEKETEEANPEQKQAKTSEMQKSLSAAEYEEYQALKKARKDAQDAEVLAKARKEQSDLIKSAVAEAVAGLRTENDTLRKSFEDQTKILKSLAGKPQQAKAITSIDALEKSGPADGRVRLSKAELLDVAEAMVKSNSEFLTTDHVTELEMTGRIYEKEAREALEREVARRYSRR